MDNERHLQGVQEFSKQRRVLKTPDGNAWISFSRTYPDCNGLNALDSIDGSMLYIIFRFSNSL